MSIREGLSRSIKLPADLPRLPDHWPLPLISQGEAELVCWLAHRVVTGNVLEIGCHQGDTTRALAHTNPDRAVYAVDWPGNDQLQQAQRHEIPSSAAIGLMTHDMANVRIITGDSQTMDWSLFQDLGLIFIDGDHSYQGVKRDTEKATEYFAQTAREGIIAWHDYYSDGLVRDWCGVNQLVDELPFVKHRYGNLVFAWVGSHNPLYEHFGPLISVCHATNRPEGWQKAYQEYMEKADHPGSIEYILSIDQDREKEFSHPFGQRGKELQFRFTVNGGRQCAVDAMNQAASVARGSLLVVGADDIFPPEHWDTQLLNLIYDLDAEVVIQTASGTPQDNRDLMVMSILTKARYDRLGYVFYPEYEGMYGDDDFTAHARADNVIVPAKHILFPHRHPLFDPSVEWDETYERQNHKARYDRGKEILERRRSANFGSSRPQSLREDQVNRPVPSAPGAKVLALCLPGELFSGRYLIHILGLYAHLLSKYIVIPMNAYSSNPSVTRHVMATDALGAVPRPDYLLWLDDDNTLTPAQFQILEQDLANYPDIDAVFGWCGIEQDQYVTPSERRRPSCGLLDDNGDCCPFTWEVMHETKALIQIGWSGMPVVLMRTRAIELAGPQPFKFIMDDRSRWGFRGEDNSFCQRAIAAGAKFVVDPRVMVPHLKLRDTSDSPDTMVPRHQSDIAGPVPNLNPAGVAEAAEESESVGAD